MRAMIFSTAKTSLKNNKNKTIQTDETPLEDNTGPQKGKAITF